METFSYKAVGADGKEKKGNITAESRQAAMKKLKDSQLMPISVEVQTALDKDINISFMKKKVTARDLSVFCRQFSSILRAGVSVINALDMLGEQTENKELKAAVKRVQSGVEKGGTLSESMRPESRVFPDLLVNMIAAGEASGSLETAIERMAVQFEKDAKIKGLVKKAMMYPMVLFCVAIIVMIVMLVYVIPQFESMFEQIGSELPIYTRIIMMVSEIIQTKWALLILIVAGIIIAYKLYYKTDSGRHTIDKLMLKIPVFGVLVTKTACARFSRTLATLLQAGMPMVEAIDTVSKIMDNIIFTDALQKAKNGVVLGFDLAGQLKSTNVFPAMVVHMTSIGEETGSIEEMLTNVANYYDEEVETTTQQVTALMEPIIIVVMAMIVLVLVMSIYGPLSVLYADLG